MVDWAQLYLFELIFMRMSGFLLFNPLLGRSNLPAMVKTGMALVLSILVFGTAGTGVPQPDTLVELAFRLLLELGIGLVLGFVMRVVFSVVQIGGEVIDTQMGMTMAQMEQMAQDILTMGSQEEVIAYLEKQPHQAECKEQTAGRCDNV
jgi:flagellar biosynthetic protein FliR